MDTAPPSGPSSGFDESVIEKSAFKPGAGPASEQPVDDSTSGAAAAPTARAPLLAMNWRRLRHEGEQLRGFIDIS
jgi:hypothetical protein